MGLLLPSDNTQSTSELGIKCLWTGHSTVVVETKGVRFITDPMFRRKLYFQRRAIPLSTDINALPQFDFILISHLHFDHLDKESLEMLKTKSDTLIIPPRGKKYIRRLGYPNIYGVKPGERVEISDITVRVVRAKHFGGRYGIDSVWDRSFQGYVVNTQERGIYFAGDTGFSRSLFRNISEQLKPELAILPIGAYRPWNFRRHHLSPEDAINAAELMRARVLFPVHHSTFRLSLEPCAEPLKSLISIYESKPRNLSVVIPQEGKWIEV